MITQTFSYIASTIPTDLAQMNEAVIAEAKDYNCDLTLIGDGPHEGWVKCEITGEKANIDAFYTESPIAISYVSNLPSNY